MVNRDRDRLDLILKLSSWIAGFIAFVSTLVSFGKLWQGDTDLVNKVLLTTIVGGAWLGCAYLAFKRTPSFVKEVKMKKPRMIWKYPRRLRLWALAGLFMIPLILVVGILAWQEHQPVATPPRVCPDGKLCVAIADFGETSNYEPSEMGQEISTMLYRALTNRLEDAGLSDVVLVRRVELLRSKAEAKDLSDEMRVPIVIWGWVPVAAQNTFVPNISVWAYRHLVKQTHFDDTPLVTVEFNTLEFGEQLADSTMSLINFVMGLSYLYDDEYDRAYESLTIAIRAADQLSQLFEEGRRDKATLDKGLAILYLFRGRVAAAKGEPALASNDFHTALQLDPQYAEPYVGLGNNYYVRGYMESATQKYEAALGIEKCNLGALYGLGNVYFSMERYEESFQQYQAAIDCAQDVNFPPAYYAVAQVHLAQGEIGEANTAFREYLELAQDVSETLAVELATTPLPTPEVGEWEIEVEEEVVSLLGGYYEEEEEEEEEEEGASPVLERRVTPETPKQKLATLKASIGFVPEIVNLERFEKISSHEHFYAGGDILAYFQAMGTLGISRVVLLPTGISPDNHGYKANTDALLQIQEQYPEKVIAFCTIDEQDPDAVEILEDCANRGGKGLKLIGWHPKYFDEPFGEPVNSPRMYKVYERARELDFPVLIHINMRDYPEWQQQFEETLQDFPDVTFIAAHYCKHSPDVENCGVLLDRYPNLFADISMGGRLRTYLKEISDDPGKFREFIIRYQDKLLWGSDAIIDSSSYKDADFFIDRAMFDITLLETGQYRQEFHSVLRDIPPELYSVDDIQLFGLNLPDDVLRKLYFQNPQKVFGLISGSGEHPAK